MIPQQHSVLRGILEWVVTFALVFVFFIFIRMFVMEPYRVPTGSMEPTIEIGDQVFAQKVTVNLGLGVKQGDIVVFRNPDGISEHDILVKRVIATGGQTVDSSTVWCLWMGRRSKSPTSRVRRIRSPRRPTAFPLGFPTPCPKAAFG